MSFRRWLLAVAGETPASAASPLADKARPSPRASRIRHLAGSDTSAPIAARSRPPPAVGAGSRDLPVGGGMVQRYIPAPAPGHAAGSDHFDRRLNVPALRSAKLHSDRR